MSKTVLITSTSSGIGKATAKFFSVKGWNVIATMRKPEKEQELKDVFVPYHPATFQGKKSRYYH